MATPTHKRLALSIIDFLSTSLKDSSLTPEDADSIEIAQNCIAECFHVDPTDSTAMKEAVGGQNLLSIYGVYEKMKGQSKAPTTSTPSSSSKESSGGAASLPKKGETGGPTDESERLKGNGNTAMQRKDYKGAIQLYTEALKIAPLNPIYLSNRAAAYSANNQHDLAKNDAELATATDPKYTKAWSRLGLSCFALGDAKAAMEAYQKGIEAEGNGGSDAMKKGYETAKRKVEESSSNPTPDLDDSDDDDEQSRSGGAGAGSGMPDLSALAGMMGGNSGGGMPDLSALAGMMGGGGRGGGMPDLGALMQNPMMRQMAQGLMSNPEMMSGLMNNPQLRNMMGGGGGAPAAGGDAGAAGGAGAGRGGMPDIGALLQNPAIADMARQFMGGAGGAGGGAGGAGGAGAGRGAGGA
ncbi:Small glutamine-rich tetratricopeptide repeat-containing protein 2 [Elasticomyces elasticus]|nr:Small glutamine-rich tetratricopeptide repeat-containing protein 2 [Elasticomyces elasticus]KAK3636211.1 Small glutamine-rich tetratricopeptide repeat-containing protein 2 [Elasticomyces elasticus]KAK4918361.1 Small glutamine-rich tetratricopeptide repeat-containing protein 2 [Elasticomyces elasticus]KAK5762690.1 Small glutamine-rich tetratricopeptide repeat-containing protein 2 [Elasticomyces elasticus]